ncbi:unnamed protein product [Linum tenue]|uniref:Uncharacterized protein n=1 Tax=Linum tenue TaxID=586396 RepID=A0AAV0LV72_9ROSI|nr:unnamed protein product [Linum tenue]
MEPNPPFLPMAGSNLQQRNRTEGDPNRPQAKPAQRLHLPTHRQLVLPNPHHPQQQHHLRRNPAGNRPPHQPPAARASPKLNLRHHPAEPLRLLQSHHVASRQQRLVRRDPDTALQSHEPPAAPSGN